MKTVVLNLCRGSKDEAFAAIRDGSVDVMINLETETRELVTCATANDELILCLDNRVRFYDFALSGYLPPEKEVVLRIIRLIDDELSTKTSRVSNDGQSHLVASVVGVHCRAGHERTGFVIAAYRVLVQGWDFTAAVAEWSAEGCSALWIAAWTPRLREVCGK